MGNDEHRDLNLCFSRTDDISMQEELEQLDKDITQERETIHLLKYDIQQSDEKLNKILSGFMSRA